jgi:hypothetical protein
MKKQLALAALIALTAAEGRILRLKAARMTSERGRGFTAPPELLGQIRAAKPPGSLRVRFPTILPKVPRHDATLGRGIPAEVTSIN